MTSGNASPPHPPPDTAGPASPAASAGPAGTEPAAVGDLIDLHVLSPSLGGAGALVFARIPGTTTVAQLKAKIHDALPLLRPPAQNQRLIYLGRALTQDTDTMADVFGASTIRDTDKQTIHLVIRGAESIEVPSATFSMPPAPVPDAAAPAAAVAHQNPAPVIQFSGTADGAAGGASGGGADGNGFQPPGSGPGLRPGPARSPARGLGFRADGRSRPRVRIAEPPAPHAYARETDANAHHRTSGPAVPWQAPGQPLPTEVPQSFDFTDRRVGSDPGLATMTEPRRGAPSGADHPAGQPPAGTTPLFSHGPPTLGRTASQVGGQVPVNTNPLVFLLSSPEGPRGLLVSSNPEVIWADYGSFRIATIAPVYTNGTVRTDTPMNRIASRLAALGRPVNSAHPQQPLPLHQSQLQQLLQQQQQVLQQHQAQQQQQQQQLQQQQQQEIQQQQHQQEQQMRAAAWRERIRNNNARRRVVAGAAGQPVNVHRNADAGLPRLVFWIWNHFWLVIRLTVFIWFLTSANSSWSRWLGVVGIAAVIFVANVGFFEGFGDALWGHMRRHLEAMIPPAELDPPARALLAAPAEGGAAAAAAGPAPGPAAGAVVAAGAATHGAGEPNPAHTAARLIAQRRANDGWLMQTIRRIERASLLFLASIAPGVAERHIAHLAAEARAERRRQEVIEQGEAAAAAVAAAAAAAAAAGAPQGDQDPVPPAAQQHPPPPPPAPGPAPVAM